MEDCNLDLDEEEETLDEDEFNIPKCSLPTLESILAEEDDDTTLGLDELSLSNIVDEGTSSIIAESTNNLPEDYRPPELDALKNWETTSIASNESRPKERGMKSVHGSVISLNRMTMLSENLALSAEKRNAGRPTVLAVSSLIGVGTSRGIVLIFGTDQKLKMSLGTSQIGDKYGGVSALEFNIDVTRMLVGYSKGEILMYDITNGKLLRTITDATPPGTAVLHVKFTDDLTLAVCNDSGGSVFELNFRRVMGVRSCESRCLFSGSRGEVCTIEPLHLTQVIADHAVRDRHLLAMGTLTKVFVVALRPKTKVIFLHRLGMNPSSAPLISWKLSNFKYADETTVDPMLMFARGDVIYFFHARCEGWDDIKFVHLRTMNLTYKIINLAWMNSQTIVLVDIKEQLHVIDVDSQTDLESKSADHIKLVYNNATFKSIATGGNVSAALATVGERACYHSLISNGGSIYLLGFDSIYITTLNNWKDRINIALTYSHQYALKLALTFYNGTAKAAIGLPSSNVEERMNLVSDMILEILVEFVDLSMTSLCPDSGKLQVLIDFYRNVVPVCVDHCLHIGRVDVLFTRIYERFRDDCIAHGAFLECLEPYIINDRLMTINPQVMKDFIEHYQAKNMLDSIERCLLHLTVQSLDLNQVMHMCWAYGLYDAIISIHSRGMNDFITPFCELLLMLQSSLKTGNPLSDKLTTLGNKLLVYMSSCLAGIAYPTGNLDHSISMSVKDQMFECLTTSFMTEKGLEGIYPVVQTLLHFSTKEFLNVLSLNFAEEYFRDDEGSSKVQCVVDILLQVMVENEGFRPDQIGSLFTFLARQSARQNSPLHLTTLLRHQVVEFLTTPSDSSTDNEERQQALVELLECGVLSSDESETTRLIELSEQASFFRVLKILHTRNRRFDLVFLAHLRDTSSDSDAFDYVIETMSNYNRSDMEKKQVRNIVMEYIKDLIKLDSGRMASLFMSVFKESIQVIADKLKDDPLMLFNFLRGIFGDKSSKQTDLITAAGISIESSYFGGDDDETSTCSYPNDPHICELYLDLLCQYKKDEVLDFVQDCSIIRPRTALDLVLRHGADDASAFLLEKSGDIGAAFNILIGVCKEKMQLLYEQEGNATSYEAINTSMDKVVRLCQRNSKKLVEKQREKLWFSLLDLTLKPQNKEVASGHLPEPHVDFCKEMARKLLNSMIGYMSLSAVLHKIIQEPAYKSGEFSEIKNLLLGMLDTYQYEKTLIGTTLHLLSRDRYKSLNQLKTSITHGITPKSQFCSICRNPLLRGGSTTLLASTQKMIVFRNGSQYHEVCLLRGGGNSQISLQSSTSVEQDRNSFESWKNYSQKEESSFVSGIQISTSGKVRERSKSKVRTTSFLQDFEDKRFTLKIKSPPLM